MRVGPTPPPHIFPTVSPVPAWDRARHRTRNHMVTTGRLVVSSELGSLPKECFKTLIAPPPAPPLLCWHADAGQGPAPAAWGLDTSPHPRAVEGAGEQAPVVLWALIVLEAFLRPEARRGRAWSSWAPALRDRASEGR